MDNKIYAITLADGTVIENLKLNGNNFISENPVSADIFDGNCSPVVISNEDYDEKHEHMELVQVAEYDGQYWFILRDLSYEELDKIKTRSDIEYLAMMAGVEL